ncbi:DUF885 family protein [Marinicella meishanensis]|uniref:DUF885 family protein n=1 Tax=Marinicella meishanensis TaxID=2873263 RepID=UPI001CBE6393|nr:DUF885 family protein [Marinicella sp. NBU2979]
MKRLVLALLGLMAGSTVAPEPAQQETISWSALAQQAQSLNIPSPRLDFAAVLQQRGTAEDHAVALKRLQRVQAQANTFVPQSWCEARAWDDLVFRLETQQLRYQLMQSAAQQSPVAAYAGRVHALPQGALWYRYLTRWWLGAEVSADALYAMGEQTFTEAIAALRQTAKVDNQPMIDSRQDIAIQAQLRASAARVEQNLDRLFHPMPGVSQPAFARSPLGPEFSAPGHYGNNTIYYNPLQDAFDLAQLDWLYIHEGIPGHHLQQQMRRLHPLCPDVSSSSPQMAFIEGWAAYTETLGHDMGWYRDQASQAYALRWASLRAMRVMIDVGIHARGWTDAEARQHWQRHFPEGADVMEREIQRIKRWPMQVITYVYGMNQIKHSLSKQAARPDFDLRTFHHQLLGLSHFPLQALTHLDSYQPEAHHE